jgi:hypothetical protein
MTTTTALRAFRAVLAALPIGVLFSLVGATHEAPLGGWNGDPVIAEINRADLPVNTPVFTDADANAFPSCTGATGGLTDKLIVRTNGDREVVTFDRALRLGERRVAWVIGSCR